jgi:hypothetical protein
MDSERPLPPIPLDDEPDRMSFAPTPSPMTQIGTLPGSPGHPLRFMLGSGSGMSIGDRPINAMRVRRELNVMPPARKDSRSVPIGPVPVRMASFAPPAPRFRGLSIDEFEGGWL